VDQVFASSMMLANVGVAKNGMVKKMSHVALDLNQPQDEAIQQASTEKPKSDKT